MKSADIPERSTEAAHEELREEAQSLLQTVLHKNDEDYGRKVGVESGRVLAARMSSNDEISAIVEIVVGPVPDMILKMIALYRPDCESLH